MVSEGETNALYLPVSVCLNPCCSGGWSRRYNLGYGSSTKVVLVLILVVLEDGLGECWCYFYLIWSSAVLILVVLEDGLGGGSGSVSRWRQHMVLILVVLEDGLGET